VIAADGQLSAGGYLFGSGALVAVLAVLGWGAWRLRGRLVPEWEGPTARLVETLLVLFGLTASAEVLGAVNALRGAALIEVCIVVGLGMALFGRRSHRPVAPRRALATSRAEAVAASVALAIVTAQWVSHVARALHRGMTNSDTLTYHGPFAVRFLQNGTFGSLAGVGGAARAVYPQNSELLHALAAVPFHRDLLSPLLNLGWATLVVLAAWCIGRRIGAGTLCVLGSAVVLGLPSLAGTQPGQASNDIICVALLVSAVALLLEAELTSPPAALAGAAAGLAMATKLIIAAPVAVLTVGVITMSCRRRRPAVAVAWSTALLLSGSYWFIRDTFVAGSPAPFLNLTIGPVSLRGAEPETGPAATHYLFDGSVWRRYYLPGLWHAFGPAWPLLLGLAIAGAAIAILSGRDPLVRLVGLATLVGALAYPFTPLTAAAGGRGFVFALRYLTPVLLVGFLLLSLALARARTPWRRAGWVAMVGLVALNACLPAIKLDGMPAWPSDGVLAGAVAGLAVLTVLAVVTAKARLPGSLRKQSPGRVALAAAVTLGAVLVGGWFVQQHYFEGRYVHAGLNQDAIENPFHGVRDASVAAFGNPEVYPMFGPDLSNRVTSPAGPSQGADAALCRRWKRILSGRYTYIALGHLYIFAFAPPQAWFTTDPASVAVTRGRDYAVFRLDGRLDPDLC
jgi:hypothetical protein